MPQPRPKEQWAEPRAECVCGGEGAEALPAGWMEGAKAQVGPGVDDGSSLVSSCGRRVGAGVLVTNCQAHHSHQFHDSRCP